MNILKKVFLLIYFIIICISNANAQQFMTIDSGIVFINGIYTKPPYNVEIKNNAIFLNDKQISETINPFLIDSSYLKFKDTIFISDSSAYKNIKNFDEFFDLRIPKTNLYYYKAIFTSMVLNNEFKNIKYIDFLESLPFVDEVSPSFGQFSYKIYTTDSSDYRLNLGTYKTWNLIKKSPNQAFTIDSINKVEIDKINERLNYLFKDFVSDISSNHYCIIKEKDRQCEVINDDKNLDFIIYLTDSIVNLNQPDSIKLKNFLSFYKYYFFSNDINAANEFIKNFAKNTEIHQKCKELSKSLIFRRNFNEYLKNSNISLNGIKTYSYSNIPISSNYKSEKGIFIYDGKYIEPPYKIIVKDLKIYVNQFPITEKYIDPYLKYIYKTDPGRPYFVNKQSSFFELECGNFESRFHSSLVHAKECYFYSNYSLEVANDSVLNFYKSLPNIKSYDGKTLITFSGDTVAKQLVPSITFQQYKDSVPMNNIQLERKVNEYAFEIYKFLETNNCILFSSWQHSYYMYDLDKVVQLYNLMITDIPIEQKKNIARTLLFINRTLINNQLINSLDAINERMNFLIKDYSNSSYFFEYKIINQK